MIWTGFFTLNVSNSQLFSRRYIVAAIRKKFCDDAIRYAELGRIHLSFRCLIGVHLRRAWK